MKVEKFKKKNSGKKHKNMFEITLLFSTWSERIRMCWIKVNFKSSEAVIEGTMDEVSDGVLHHDCHEQWNQEGESNTSICHLFDAN